MNNAQLNMKCQLIWEDSVENKLYMSTPVMDLLLFNLFLETFPSIFIQTLQVFVFLQSILAGHIESISLV